MIRLMCHDIWVDVERSIKRQRSELMLIYILSEVIQVLQE